MGIQIENAGAGVQKIRLTVGDLAWAVTHTANGYLLLDTIEDSRPPVGALAALVFTIGDQEWPHTATDDETLIRIDKVDGNRVEFTQ